MLGPHDFGCAPDFGPLDRDRGVSLQLGAFLFCARGGVAIVGGLAAPHPQDQRQQIQQGEERDRQNAQGEGPGAAQGQVIHRDPPRTQAMAGIGHHGVPCVRQGLLVAGDGGVQCGCLPVARGQRAVQLALCVAEQLVGGPRLGTAAGNAGDPGLRAGRRRVVFAARDHQSVVQLPAGLLDAAVQCAARRARLLQRRGGLGHRRCRIRRAQRSLVETAPDSPGEEYECGQLADDHSEDDRDDGTTCRAGPTAGRTAGDGSGDRPDQQAENQGRRDDRPDRG